MHAKSENISIDDAIIVKQCQRGDSDSMGRLIIKYQDRLYNAILKICGNPDDAAELTQESFVKVLENIGTFRSQSSFYTWLFRVGINLTLTFCSRRLRLGMRSLDNSPGGKEGLKLADVLADTKQETPLADIEKREMIQRILAALEKLEDHQRVIVVLRDIEGMSYEQIADVLQLETGTVKSRLSRARLALRELLQAVWI
ncbi:MAG TPA: sigma-70 family RNA polymerase sigma factor [Anaerohalosphaeraceae bacterium]|nr:sigma-70 family RNA polymerase sigma factor [Anaerohalosphaeraceae bacterium]